MSKVSKCFPKRMILGAKRDPRAEGAGREGCMGVCWSTSQVSSGRKLLLHGPDDFCPFSPTRHSIPTYMEFRSGVCGGGVGVGGCVLRHVGICNPMDCSPPGSSIHRILQARTLE